MAHPQKQYVAESALAFAPGAASPNRVLRPPPAAKPRADLQMLEAGLLAPQAHIDPKFLYDQLGSTLFTAITLLPEYYPTRCEAEILTQHSADIAAAAGPVNTLLDLGAGDCVKAEKLLPVLKPRQYMPIDISADYLRQAVQRLRRSYPDLTVLPIEQDFTAGLQLPPILPQEGRLAFFPGSSIGNLDPVRACKLLSGLVRQKTNILIGVDRIKPRAILEEAYDDALQLTAAFNLNMLRHANQILGSDFDVNDWQHVARHNEALQRIEMHLQARRIVQVSWPNECRQFAEGETIHTENSYKYSTDGFEALLREAGYQEVQVWSDSRDWFSVYYASV